MERPERPTRHRSNPVVKPKLVHLRYSSDSESELNDESAPVAEVPPSFYRPVDNTDSGPSTSSGAPQPVQTSEMSGLGQTSGEPKTTLGSLFSVNNKPGAFSAMKALQPRQPVISQEPESESTALSRPDSQSQEPVSRNRKRTTASTAASVLFETVDSLISSNTSVTSGVDNTERSSDSPDRQEFQHNDFVIRPRSFCSIEYCNSSGTRVPYKHKRLNAPIDLTASLPPTSSNSGRSTLGMSSGGPSGSCTRSEPNDSNPYLSRSSPLYQRREHQQPQPCTSSILRQFDELINTPPHIAKRPRRTGFNVRFCDNPVRFVDESNNDDSNNIPFLSGEPPRPHRSSNLDDYCDLVGNFLFNHPSISSEMNYPPLSPPHQAAVVHSNSTRDVNHPTLSSDVVRDIINYPNLSSPHISNSTRNHPDTFQPSSPRSSPPLFTPREREQDEDVVVRLRDNNLQTTSLTIPRCNNIISINTNTNNGESVSEDIEQQSDDVILVELPERPPFSPRSPLSSPIDSPPPPYVVPSSRSPTLSPPQPVHASTASILRNKTQNNNSSVDVPMTLQELNQMLVSLLECPVCLDHATPPIYQCCKGHIVCQNCHPRLSICPICRSRLPGDRNSSMEKVAEKLMYPCKNTLTGCTMMLKLDDKQGHEEGCGFRHYSCIVPSCHWKGYKPELVVHLQSDHPDKLIDGANKEVLVPLSVPLGSGMLIAHHWIQSAHNEVFNVIFHVDLYKRVMKGCVTYIGAPEKANKFVYQFELKQQSEPFRKLIYSRATSTDTRKPSQQMSIDNDFSINIDQARFYRPENIPTHVIPINISIDLAPGVPAPTE